MLATMNFDLTNAPLLLLLGQSTGVGHTSLSFDAGIRTTLSNMLSMGIRDS